MSKKDVPKCSVCSKPFGMNVHPNDITAGLCLSCIVKHLYPKDFGRPFTEEDKTEGDRARADETSTPDFEIQE